MKEYKIPAAMCSVLGGLVWIFMNGNWWYLISFPAVYYGAAYLKHRFIDARG